MKSLLGCALALTFLLSAGCSPDPTATSAVELCNGCNVILISLDTLRADRMSLYGYPRPTTPNLEAFAQQAIVYDDFVHNGGGTLPSHMTMLTSLNPGVHGLRPENPESLPAARVTLAEQLRDAGFSTAAFVDGGWMRSKFGFAQGFETYDDDGGRFAKILPKALRWIDDRRDQRLFLFLHTYDAHSEWRQLPYDCPGGHATRYARHDEVDFDGCRNGQCASRLLLWMNQQISDGVEPTSLLSPEELTFVSDLYDGCINYVDERVATLFDELRARDLFDNSLILLTSDHGEEFLEHGLLLHSQGGYEELVRIPLVIKLPHAQHGGTRVPHLGSVLDLMPTILDIVGVEPNPEVQGRSLVPTFLEDRPVRSAVHFYNILRTDRWKYFFRRDQLFDYVADRAEQRNLAGSRPEIEGRLQEEIQAMMVEDSRHAESLATADEATAVQLTPEETEELKALGYLDG